MIRINSTNENFSKKLNNPKPDWLKVRMITSDNYLATKRILEKNNLNTVCVEARCPNIYECWDRKTATIMILGDICTRSCGFCSVKTGKPLSLDNKEPLRTANAVKMMRLKHVVITSVDRDDIKEDYGSSIWAKTVEEIHRYVPDCQVEVLTPDFRGNKKALLKVFRSNPAIFSHNIECVKRVSREVRPQSDWDRSKNVLSYAVKNNMVTKTGMMVGLGETDSEVYETLMEISELGVEIFNIGQYLQPTRNHLPISRYVHPDLFNSYKEFGLRQGFRVIESGPLVRSSYHADEQVKLYQNKENIDKLSD